MRRILGVIFVSLATALLLLNGYGLTKTLEPVNIQTENLRFGQNDVTLSKEDFIDQIEKGFDETPQAYAQRLTHVISAGLAHVHWEKYDPDRFNQRVPVWENYLLYAMGRWSSIPEFERYHFVTPSKAIERGIGICGDASMLMSELFKQNQIKNQIITVPGHVMVEVDYGGRKQLLDPDFGVVLNHSGDYYRSNPEALLQQYQDSGFVSNGEDVVYRGISQKITYWDGAEHFITNKYYFEKISYWLIWLFPLILLVLGWFLLSKGRDADALD